MFLVKRQNQEPINPRNPTEPPQNPHEPHRTPQKPPAVGTGQAPVPSLRWDVVIRVDAAATEVSCRSSEAASPSDCESIEMLTADD